MTDVELPPLLEPLTTHESMEGLRMSNEVLAYAGARGPVARDAEIRALRAEVDMLRGKVDEAVVELLCRKARVEQLTEALREARDMVEEWAGYASDYFREKHDLAGDLAKIDSALLRGQEEGRE